MIELSFNFISEEEIQEIQLLSSIEIASESTEGSRKYNQILKRILERHVDDFVDTSAEMIKWRKRIKSWILALDKPETRGGLVIPSHLTEQFNQEVVQLLNRLHIRSIPLLREGLLEIIQKLLRDKPFDPNTCSKHWWFAYQKKYPELAALWEALPLERSLNKVNRDQENQPLIGEAAHEVNEEISDSYSDLNMDNLKTELLDFDFPLTPATLSPPHSNMEEENSPVTLEEETKENYCPQEGKVDAEALDFSFLTRDIPEPKQRPSSLFDFDDFSEDKFFPNPLVFEDLETVDDHVDSY